MTSTGRWRLKVRVIWDKNYLTMTSDEPDYRAGTHGRSEWDDFQVGSEATNYQLGIGNQRSKDNWDGDQFHVGGREAHGLPFSTRDRDNDRYGHNCAYSCQGGWWHKFCYDMCLTCNRPIAAVKDPVKWRLPATAEMWIQKV